MRIIHLAIYLGVLSLVCGCEEGGIIGDDDVLGDDDTSATGDDDDAVAHTTEDLFVQEVQATDVLFVVDNSCSMMEEQVALTNYFAVLLQHLFDKRIDYHIGTTVLDDWNTQPPIGELYGSTPYIDTTTPDPILAFEANMTMGADGMGSCEVGLEAIQRAVTSPLIDGPNAGFYRPEARLAVVVISDEVDGCIYGCDAICWNPFIGWFTSFKADGEASVHFTAIVGDEKSGCSSSWGAADPGQGYLEVVEELGEDHAVWQSICAQDWTPVMHQVGGWAAGVPLSFALSETPIEGSLQAFLDLDGAAGPNAAFPIFEDESYEETHAFVYDGDSNSLVFVQATAPSNGAELRVEYEVANR
jgi:hypothetical protein